MNGHWVVSAGTFSCWNSAVMTYPCTGFGGTYVFHSLPFLGLNYNFMRNIAVFYFILF